MYHGLNECNAYLPFGTWSSGDGSFQDLCPLNVPAAPKCTPPGGIQCAPGIFLNRWVYVSYYDNSQPQYIYPTLVEADSNGNNYFWACAIDCDFVECKRVYKKIYTSAIKCAKYYQCPPV